MDAHLAAVDDMVGASFAHPSVIMHAFFNEGPSNDPGACHGYKAMADRIRARVVTPGNPPMRFATWANNHVTQDACIEHEDVISFNSYPGCEFVSRPLLSPLPQPPPLITPPMPPNVLSRVQRRRERVRSAWILARASRLGAHPLAD